MIELIYQYIKLIIELVIYICLVAQVRKVSRGLSLIVQLLSFHVVRFVLKISARLECLPPMFSL